MYCRRESQWPGLRAALPGPSHSPPTGLPVLPQWGTEMLPQGNSFFFLNSKLYVRGALACPVYIGVLRSRRKSKLHDDCPEMSCSSSMFLACQAWSCDALNLTVFMLSLCRGSQMALPGSKSTSKYKGVTWNSLVSKWAAVTWDWDAKKARPIGFFDTEEQVISQLSLVPFLPMVLPTQYVEPCICCPGYLPADLLPPPLRVVVKRKTLGYDACTLYLLPNNHCWPTFTHRLPIGLPIDTPRRILEGLTTASFR